MTDAPDESPVRPKKVEYEGSDTEIAFHEIQENTETPSSNINCQWLGDNDPSLTVDEQSHQALISSQKHHEHVVDSNNIILSSETDYAKTRDETSEPPPNNILLNSIENESLSISSIKEHADSSFENHGESSTIIEDNLTSMPQCESQNLNTYECLSQNCDLVENLLNASQALKESNADGKFNIVIGSDTFLIDKCNVPRTDLVDIIQAITSQLKLSDENSRQKTETLLLTSESSRSPYEEQIESLNLELSQTKKTLDESKQEKEEIQDQLTRENVAIREELTNRLEQLMIQCQSSNKDRESMVMKYAISENEVLKLKKQKEAFDKKIKELQRDKELLQNKLKSLTIDKSKISNVLDGKIQEHNLTLREIERLKEETNAKDVKMKWGQTKLRTELDAHKETQSKLSKALEKITNHEAELQTMKKHAEKIVQDSIENENSRANLLEKQLKEHKAIIITECQKKDDLSAYLKSTTSELEALKSVYFTLGNDSSILREKVVKYEQEREESEKLFTSLQAQVINARKGAADLSIKLSSSSAAAELLEKEQTKVQELEEELKVLKSSLEDQSAELAQCRSKETELLTFTQKLTDQNVKLQSQVTSLEGKICLLEMEKGESRVEYEETKDMKNSLKEELNSLKKLKSVEIEKLKGDLTAKTDEVAILETKVSDLYNEIKVQQKRHHNSTKDINREITKLRKRLELFEHEKHSIQNDEQCEERDEEKMNYFSTEISSHSSHSESPFSSSGLPMQDSLSNTSRTHSNSSLNAIDMQVTNGRPHKPSSIFSSEEGLSPNILVERIIRLQKEMMKKAEKIDFLEEHVNQLVSELKKKNKIIHHYIMKEETGVMSNSKSDSTKAEMIRRGGIMASVYGSTPKDGNMTLELSLEINKKLQAVLEDTLLKNITLKENLNTLGDEVANLSLQNSRLNLAKKP